MEYDYINLKNSRIPMKLVSVISQIEAKSIRIESYKKENDQLFCDLQHASELVTRKRMYARRLSLAGYPGYIRAMNAVLEGKAGFHLDDICQLYRILTGGQEKNEGCFSSEKALEEFVGMIDGYHKAFKDSDIHGLLLISIVLYDFGRLSPFQKGNEMMGELLSWILLLEHGIEIGKYAQTEREKIGHIFSMANLVGKWEFSEVFLHNLLECITAVYERIERGRNDRLTKKKRIENVVAGSSILITKTDIQQILQDVSTTTVEAQLGELCREKVIEKHGANRNASYIRKGFFSEYGEES